jgi:hypothetical protein
LSTRPQKSIGLGELGEEQLQKEQRSCWNPENRKEGQGRREGTCSQWAFAGCLGCLISLNAPDPCVRVTVRVSLRDRGAGSEPGADPRASCSLPVFMLPSKRIILPVDRLSLVIEAT